MTVRQLTVDEKKNRIVVPLTETETQAIRHISQTARALGIDKDDILYIELVSGFLIDMPRIGRRVAVQEGVCNVWTTTHIRAIHMDSEGEWVQLLCEAITYHIEDEPMEGGYVKTMTRRKNNPMAKVDMVEHEATKEHGAWKNACKEKMTQAEGAVRNKTAQERVERLMNDVRQRFSAQALCALDADALSSVRIDGLTLFEVANCAGVDITGKRIHLLKFAAEVYGEDHAAIQQSLKKVRAAYRV